MVLCQSQNGRQRRLWSHVQVRGSIPLFWRQLSNLSWQPRLGYPGKVRSQLNRGRGWFIPPMSCHLNEPSSPLPTYPVMTFVWHLLFVPFTCLSYKAENQEGVQSAPCHKHLSMLLGTYGRVAIVNLIDSCGRGQHSREQATLGGRLADNVRALEWFVPDLRPSSKPRNG